VARATRPCERRTQHGRVARATSHAVLIDVPPTRLNRFPRCTHITPPPITPVRQDRPRRASQRDRTARRIRRTSAYPVRQRPPHGRVRHPHACRRRSPLPHLPPLVWM